ncbi:MAG: hypothetical protein J0I68_09510 [Achromobacter sp.]|jgi:hypothetical protein|uniref:Uncharacterized protein n=1 Tax=Achromobacter insuavis TaxID=1287735 RepID=A0A6J4ZTG5_9BURK|nr:MULTISPECIES: hypothetical protein [Achromobacter]MBN9638765.1 hypothetical protein [Achromobacter sp.]CAB3633134.1 hypothetical protein LMG26845_01092 [Achromobacter insuavis]CUI80465.1 Uncharacterised protein [Achromobacter sp. 2789STDY5608621]CUJ18350.1 Uncharacterised protein [Achromobacter sp. 2789STDY5608633]CUJ39105.1 Uncharacterised protein [Achromobacter sp. 2789STDY5608628]
MRQILVYSSFSWLALAGGLHFAIDVVAQFARGARAPGPETTLYYGLHSAYALGLVLFGGFGLLVARQAPALLSQWPALALTVFAAAAWLVLAFVFIEYRPPRILISVFAVLALSMVATR